MKIREFVLVILVSFLLFLAVARIASSQTVTCDSDQRIFRLNWESNSHAAAWDQAAYAVEICYDDYFTLPSQETGSAAHACTADNKLLSLSQVVNAHSSFAGGASYPINVCHAGLQGCTLEQNIGNNTCGADKAAIVFLSNSDNAHTSRLYSSLYDYVICCDGKYGNPIGYTPTPTPEEEFESVCADYQDENSCTTDAQDAAQNDPGCNATDKSACYCKWEDKTGTSNDKCILEYDVLNAAEGCSFTCSKSMVDYEDVECVGDLKEVGIIATRNPSTCPDLVPPTCTDSTVSVPCGFEFAELPFFGVWQFIAASLGVAFIYFVTRKIKRG